MPRCELTGKGPCVVNLVSHSKRRTKSISQPNIQQKQLFSNALNKIVSLKLATSTIRSIDHVGGFDRFILKQSDTDLSHRAKIIKKQIKRKLSGKSKKGVPNEAKD